MADAAAGALARRPKRSDLAVADVLRVVAERTYRSRAERERYGHGPGSFGAWMSGILSRPAEPDMCDEFPQFPPKVVIARLLQLSSNRGGHLIDYGVVVTRPFITPEGEAYLRDHADG